MRAALFAGWRRRDLWWERLTERGCANLADGRIATAARRFNLAALIARAGFSSGDPRMATSLANLGSVAARAGRDATARRRYARAAAAWPGAAAVPDHAAFAPRARSSLFHLRMERLHGETYRAGAQLMLETLSAEAGARLARLADGRPEHDTADHAALGRWAGERRAAFDDRRKFVSACLLIAG